MSKYLTNYRANLKAHFITIDPGARADGGTGLAYWKNDISPHPIFTKQISSVRGSHQQKVEEILYNTASCIETLRFSHAIALKDLVVAVEKPQFFDSYKGHVAAKSDSLFKLINFYSRLEEKIKNQGVDFLPVEISHWKGQLSKSKISSRVESICGRKFVYDVTDAVGIGLFLKGLL